MWVYQSANQPQPAKAEDDNSQFKALEVFINVVSDDYTISVTMPKIIVGHDHTIYIDKYESMQFGSKNETGGSTIFIYIKSLMFINLLKFIISRFYN